MNQGTPLIGPPSNVSSADWSENRYDRVFGASIAIANRRLEILQWISPSVPWERHEDISNGRVDGVGQWFLQTEEFVKWRYGEGDVTNQVLFGYGGAGVGKTYLSSLLVDTLREGIDKRNEIVSGVYCDFYTHGDQAITSLLGTLLKQMMSKMNRVPREINEAFNRAKGRLDGGIARLPEILGMLICALSSVQRAYICIDGLDEFPAEHRPMLFRALEKVIEDLPGTRLYLTGRPDIQDEVERGFTGGVQVRYIEPPEEDIERYLRMRLEQDKHPDAMDEELRVDIMKIVPKAASEIFLLPSFKIDAILAQNTIVDRKEKLKKMANYGCVRDVYNVGLNQILKLGEQSRTIATEVLLWASHSERPMKAGEICHALQTEFGPDRFGLSVDCLIDLVLGCSQGLVTLDKKASTLRLRHFTLRNHLCEHLGMFDMAHSKIAGVCLNYLNSKGSKRIPDDTLLGQYASSHWVTHARRQTTESVRSLALKLLSDYQKGSKYCIYSFGEKGIWPELYQPSYTAGFTALHYTALLGINDFADDLLRSKSWTREVNQTDSCCSTPLVWASRYGNEEVVKQLLKMKNIKPDLPDTLFYRTPLSWAAERGNERIVQLLLAENSVDPNTQCDQGRTPLLWAVNSRQESIVKLLLENKKVDPNTPNDPQTRTPLFWAVKNGHLGIIKLLLHNKKVNPNIPEYYTPLHWAAEHGDEDAVSLLLEREDIKPDLVDRIYLTPLSLASKHGHRDVVKLLMERKDVDHNSFDEQGRTPLINAVINNHKGVVERLLEAGDADANWGDNNGRTSLHWSARLGNESIVRLLLRQQHLDPNPLDISGKTPLSYAAEDGCEQVVKIFLEVEEINPCLLDDNGWTPLDWARLGQHKSVVRLLQECKGVIPRSWDGVSRTLPLDPIRGLEPSMQMRGELRGFWKAYQRVTARLQQPGDPNTYDCPPARLRPPATTRSLTETPPTPETE